MFEKAPDTPRAYTSSTLAAALVVFTSLATPAPLFSLPVLFRFLLVLLLVSLVYSTSHLASFVFNEAHIDLALSPVEAPLSQLLSSSGFGDSGRSRGRTTAGKVPGGSTERDRVRSGGRDRKTRQESKSAARDIDSWMHSGAAGGRSSASGVDISGSPAIRSPFSLNFSYTPPKSYPFGAKSQPNKERARGGQEGDDGWAGLLELVGHPGSIARLGRTLYGKVIRLCWRDVCTGGCAGTTSR